MKTLELSELQEAWEENEDDIHVNLTTGEAFYQGKLIVPRDQDGIWSSEGIIKWMVSQQYWPNVWLVNDHGNVELVGIQNDGTVTYHGGLV